MPIEFFKLFTTELEIMNFSKEALAYTESFFFLFGVYMLLSGFILPINNLLLGVFRAKGQAISATYLNIIGAVINIALDALFIIYFGS